MDPVQIAAGWLIGSVRKDVEASLWASIKSIFREDPLVSELERIAEESIRSGISSLPSSKYLDASEVEYVVAIIAGCFSVDDEDYADVRSRDTFLGGFTSLVMEGLSKCHQTVEGLDNGIFREVSPSEWFRQEYGLDIDIDELTQRIVYNWYLGVRRRSMRVDGLLPLANVLNSELMQQLNEANHAEVRRALSALAQAEEVRSRFDDVDESIEEIRNIVDIVERPPIDLAEEGNFDLAEHAHKKKISQGGDEALQHHAQLAYHLYLQRGPDRYDEAIQHAQEALRSGSPAVLACAWYVLGNIYSERNEHNKARAAYGSIISEPRFLEILGPHIYVFAGGASMMAGQPEEAAAHFRAAIRLDDNLIPDATFGLCYCLCRLRRFEEAEELLRSITEDVGAPHTYPNAQLLLAEILEMQGKISEAGKILRGVAALGDRDLSPRALAQYQGLIERNNLEDDTLDVPVSQVVLAQIIDKMDEKNFREQ